MYWFFVAAVAVVGLVWTKVRRQRKAAAAGPAVRS
jgi:hypothetical protein